MKKLNFRLLPLAMAGVMLLAGCSSKTQDVATTDNIDQYVTLGEYKGLPYTKAVTTVTDAELEEAIQGILAGSATTEAVTGRAIQNGDIANIDYEGLLDGVAFDGGTDTGYDLTIGSGTFIPGFEEQLVGVKTGETKELDVTFPEDYGSADLAGKAVVFVVKVNEIKEKVTPILDQKFVVTHSDFNSVEEYKSDLKASLEADKKSTAEYDIKLAILSEAVSNSTVIKYPQDELKGHIDQMKSTYEGYASQYGVSFDEFVTTYFGKTMEEFDAEIEVTAEEIVAEKLVMLAIAKTENITVSDEDYETSVANYTESFGYPSTDEFVKQFGKETIMEQTMFDKVLDLIYSNGVAQ